MVRKSRGSLGVSIPEKALPFEIKVPNAEMRAAMSELEQTAGRSFDNVDDLMADLRAED
jgi:DNA-damage-inducible protein J